MKGINRDRCVYCAGKSNAANYIHFDGQKSVSFLIAQLSFSPFISSTGVDI